MKQDSGFQAAQQIHAELQRLRSTAGRAETVARLKLLASEAYGPNSISIPKPGGVAHVRWQAAQAIATLGLTYEKSADPVPDRLWAEAVNRTAEWVRAEE